MENTKDHKNFKTVNDLLDEITQRQIPVVSENATINHIIDSFTEAPYSRLLYVVDEEKRLVGVISLGDLIRHVFFHYYDQVSYLDTRNLVNMAVCETAKDFMQKEPLSATASDSIESILEKMLRHSAKEIPILDEGKKIVADLTMVDLLKHHQSIKRPDLLEDFY